MSVLELFLLEMFRISFYCHLLFNYQCSLLSRDSLIRLSQPLCPCQQLFLSFLFFQKLIRFFERLNRISHFFFVCQYCFLDFFAIICPIFFLNF